FPSVKAPYSSSRWVTTCPPFLVHGSVSLERIYERLEIGFLNHPLVVVAEKFLQAIGVHDVLAGHVRDGVRRNRRNVPIPQELQNAAHGPLSGDAQQFGVRYLETLREGQRIAASGNVQDRQPLRFRFPRQDPR